MNEWQGYCTLRTEAGGLASLWHRGLRWSSVWRESVISRAAGGPEVRAGHSTPWKQENRMGFQLGAGWYLPPGYPGIWFSTPPLLTSHHCCGATFARPSGPELCSEDNSGCPRRKRKQDYVFSIREREGGERNSENMQACEVETRGLHFHASIFRIPWSSFKGDLQMTERFSGPSQLC